MAHSPEETTAGKPWQGWLFPSQAHLHARARLVSALVLEITLAVFVWSHWNRLDDLRNPVYSPQDPAWAYTIGIWPAAIMIMLAPVWGSRRQYVRWMGVVLFIFPLYVLLRAI